MLCPPAPQGVLATSLSRRRAGPGATALVACFPSPRPAQASGRGCPGSPGTQAGLTGPPGRAQAPHGSPSTFPSPRVACPDRSPAARFRPLSGAGSDSGSCAPQTGPGGAGVGSGTSWLRVQLASAEPGRGPWQQHRLPDSGAIPTSGRLLRQDCGRTGGCPRNLSLSHSRVRRRPQSSGGCWGRMHGASWGGAPGAPGATQILERGRAAPGQ